MGSWFQYIGEEGDHTPHGVFPFRNVAFPVDGTPVELKDPAAIRKAQFLPDLLAPVEMTASQVKAAKELAVTKEKAKAAKAAKGPKGKGKPGKRGEHPAGSEPVGHGPGVDGEGAEA